MKKQLFLGGVAILMGFSAATAYIAHSTAPSGLMRANIEALTQIETGDDGESGWRGIPCYGAVRTTPKDPTVYEPVWEVVSCGNCRSVQCFEFINGSSCIKSGFNFC